MASAERGTDASSASAGFGEQGENIVDAAAEQARAAAREQKSVAARAIGRVAGALHQTAGNLERERDSSTARYFHQAADGMERFSATLEEQDLDNLLLQSQEYARRHPAAVFCGAMAAGFALSRFLKSSTPSRTAAGRGRTEAVRREPTPTGGLLDPPEDELGDLEMDPYGPMPPPESERKA